MQPIGNPYTPLSAGVKLWHVYKDPHAENSFNPQSTGRFAGQDADPPRAMYYAASTSELLADLPDATGLRWPSKQANQDDAYVFYEPPAGPDDMEILETIALESPMGERLLDQALARAGMRRLASSELETELARELPRDMDP